MSPRKHQFLILVGIVSLFFGVNTSLFSQTTENASLPTHSAHPNTTAINIDGQLDEADWLNAEPISDFTQFQPDEGAIASHRTEVRILYGRNSLYIGAKMFDDDPDAIEASLGRRDVFNRADWFWLSIDSYLDKKTSYTFGVNAAGVQLDAIQASGRRTISGGDAGPAGDVSWDAIWTSAQRVTHEGWIAEISIPYSMLRFQEAAVQSWGIHISRSIPRLGEESEWPRIPRVERINRVAKYGLLTDLRDLKPKRNIQVTPYTVSRVQRNEDPDVTGTSISSRSFEVGSDFKIALGTNVTLDATINPDFGQVESDPSVLNLTAFETFFQERRPFFLEGSQIFDFDVGPAFLLYSRRIGGRAPIIGAVKLSGRTEKGFSFGVLGASSGEDLDPSRGYGVVRVTQQVGSYSRIGAMITGSDLTAGSLGRLRSSFTGVDYDLRFLDNMYDFEGFIGSTIGWGSAVSGNAQRGYGAKFLFRKRRGALTGLFGIEGFDKKFQISDLGLLRSGNNFFAIPLLVSYDLNDGQAFGPFLRASVRDFAIQNFSVDDGLNQGQRHSARFSGLLKSFQSLSIGASGQNIFGGYNINETRGLGPWKAPRSIGFSESLGTDQRRTWMLDHTLGFAFSEYGGRTFDAEIEGNWNIGSRISLSGSVEGSWENDVLAWASNELLVDTDGSWMIGDSNSSIWDSENLSVFDDGGQLASALSGVDPLFDGHYYVPIFGARDTRSVDVTLRNTVTLTPSFSIQVYSQFFAARGAYDQFRLLQNRDDLASFDAFPKRDEFNFSTLQSNVVMRWEYRPGSAVFLVWTHNRRADDVLNPLGPWGDSPFDRGFGGQVSDTFDRIPTNVVLVKASYAFLN